MRLIRFFMRRSRPAVLLAILAGILSGATSAGLIALIHRTLDTAAPDLARMAWMFAALCALQVAGQVAAEILLLRLTEDTILDLRLEMGRRILAAPLRRLEDAGSHRLLATIAGDVRSIADAVTLSPLLFMNIAILLGCLFYMAWLSWQLFLFVFGFLTVVMFLYQQASRRGARFLAMARNSSDSVYGALRGLTEGTKELKLHAGRRRAFLRDILGESSRELRRYTVVGMLTYRTAGVIGRVMFMVLIGLLLFLAPSFLAVGREETNGFVLVILYMLMPLTALLNTLPNIGAAQVALNKVERLGLFLSESVSEKNEPMQLPAAPSWRSLEMAGVTHTYRTERDDDEFSLGPIDLTFRPGELVFIVGGNGSGKTTLAKLLVGLYTPESGEIRLDGEPVTDASLEWYRQHFTMVFSDFYLFDQLLGIGFPDLDVQAKSYLVKLGLDSKLKIEGGHLSTTGLSQGQRKRLSLLTAYLEDRPIYVFDEWAADQDPTFKAVFYRELLPELKRGGKTVFVITHDDHYFDLADRVVKLDSGQVDLDARGGGAAVRQEPRERVS
jgi:putative ATP-binding cassette transporter